MATGREVRFGRHRFDPRAGRLWAGRRELKLTPRAAAVLTALIERAGEPVTRDELYRSVWGDAVVSDAALTACIQELRGVLEDDARRPRFIETRHRRGYRFVAVVAPSEVPPSEVRAPADAAPRPPALVVGRDRELRELRACLARALDGERQIVFVTGDPGIGKTTVVEALLAGVSGGDRLRVARGRCIETHGAGEAYLPLLEAMTRLCREPGGQRIARLLRHHAPTWLAEMPSVVAASERGALRRQASGVSRERMLRELAEAVEVLAQDETIVLCIEDLHWSDPSTVDWLAYLAKRPGPARILVLASYRPRDAIARGHPLVAVKDELSVHGHCREIALSPLDERSAAEYLARRFSPAVARTELAGMILQRTGGNSLFLVSVADDLVSRGVLVDGAGHWELAEGAQVGDVAVPEDIRRMIGHEQDRLERDDRRVLEAASVAGVQFSVAAVAAAADLDLDDVERRCADLARRGSFLRAVGSEVWPDGTVAGRYGFRHALYQAIVYDRISAGRLAQLHRRVGGRLEAGAGERADELAAELAMHFERGRDAGRAVGYLRRAGEIAAQRSAAREAVGHLTRGLDLLRAEPDRRERAEQEVALQIALGPPLMAMNGRGAPEVERVYTRAQELCEQISDPPRLFPVLWGLFLFRRSRGELAVAHALAERLLALAERTDDSGLVIEAHHALWATLFARGQLVAAQQHAERALRLYDADRHGWLAGVYGNHDPAVCALGHEAWALELCGDPQRASRQSDRALALARGLGHPFSEAHALLYGARLYQFRGDWRTARDRAESAAALAGERGFAQLQAWAAMTRGWAVALSGEIGEGLEAMRAGIAAIGSLGSEEFKTYFLAVLAETLGGAGQPAAALDVVEEALAAAEKSGERFYAAELQRARGECLLAMGHDRGEVARCFEAALELARHQGAGALERRALQSVGAARGLA